ncbi:glycosyltransferase [uncultured Pseudokineococcus sp.]|uniref:glycosyltransferase n=1 Tax=uncultured Pseudokineococcus sp. TaxID=1642928 RepID=UPI00261D4B27|nr:glycosyltransferase [uncultured Pseudokineococcus sp.]
MTSRYGRAVARRVRGSRALLAVGRAASFPVVARSALFDRSWYEAQVGERFPSRTAAVLHYLRRGSPDGLSPCRLFEAEWYQPGRWRTAPLDPLAHFLVRGRPSAQPHPLFDPRAADRLARAASPRSVRPAAGRGPTSPPARALLSFLAAAEPATPMPVPVPVPTERPSPATAAGRGLVLPVTARPPTWGELRDLQDATLARHHEQERLRRAPRTSRDHDATADAEVVARWARAPLPTAPPRRDGPAPLVSVVMPVRDREAVVGAAVRSVLAQDVGAWELLVVDDGSRDGTRAAVREAASDDPRVVLLTGAARGVAAARNTGLARASGRYVAFLDSDNTWTPHFLRTVLAAVAAERARAAYGVARVVREGGDVFRDLDAQADHLAVRNHVDLNVLVVERDLVEKVGGFDEGLRRTVDYDLVWKVARRSTLLHVPVVGVVYDDDRGADRLSTRERASWKEVVRRAHLVDWEALSRTGRRAGRTSVVVTARAGWAGAWRQALALLPAEGGQDRELVVVDAGGRPSTGRLLAVLASVDPRVHVLRTPDDVGPALGADLGLAESTGERVLLLAEDAAPADGAVDALEACLDGTTAAAEALLTDWRDVVSAAGLGGGTDDGPPERLLEDLPREDARRAGERLAVPALTGEAMLCRAADLVAVRGADPLLAGGLWGADLSLRLRARRPGSALVVVTSSEVCLGSDVALTRRPVRRTPLDPREVRADVVELRSRWASELERDGALSRSLLERADPRVRRRSPSTAPAVVVEAPPRLRWAVQTATPAGRSGDAWGDLHFGRAVAEALEALGQEVVVDNRVSSRRGTVDLDDVVLSIRGKVPLRPQPGAVNLLWVISHPDLVGPREAARYDAVHAASRTWSPRGRRTALPLLQATDPARFHPAAEPWGERHDVLFVGNSRAVYRPVVRALVDAGHDVAVYGGGWEPFLPAGVLRATSLDNARLSGAYRAAGVVLNDHWPDMRRAGFLSNRLFDAAASGARVVSDHVEGVEEVFGPLVRTYRDLEELVALVAEGPSGFPDDDERARLGREIGRQHSFQARARTLLGAALAARAG